MKIDKKILILLVATTLPSHAAKLVAPSDDYSWKWKIGNVELSILQNCHTITPFEPIVCNEAYLYLASENQKSSAFSDDVPTFDKPHAKLSVGRLKIDDYTNDGAEIFRTLMQADQAIVRLTTIYYPADSQTPIKTEEDIILGNFQEQALETIHFWKLYSEERRAEKEKKIILKTLAAIVGFVITMILVITKLLPYVRRKTQAIYRSSRKSQEIKRSLRVAEDEAIRQTVRLEINSATDEELQALKQQVKAALDSGDTETANNLTGILRKLESDLRKTPSS